jgi:hypothetical protein
MTLDELLALSDDEFRNRTANSAIRRCKADGMRRNAGIVKENLSAGPVAQPAARYSGK